MTTSTTNDTPIVYKNPTPVAVLLTPVVEKTKIELVSGTVELDITSLLAVIRGIEPRIGQTALPGGFVDELESIETGGARELKEETGLIESVDDIRLYKSEITPFNQVLVFCVTPTYGRDVLGMVKLNPEVLGFDIVNAQTKLAFPLHEKVARKFLNESNMKVVNGFDGDKKELFEALKVMGHFSEDFVMEVSKKMKP